MPINVISALADDFLKYLVKLGLLDAATGIKMRGAQAKTGNYTILTGTDPSGSIFTNRGAGGGVTLTLPAPTLALEGTYYKALVIVAQSLGFAAPTADTLITDNDAAADSIASSRIGTEITVYCDGISWIATVSGIPQAAFAQNATVTT